MVSKLIAESKIPPDARLKSCQGRQKERKKMEHKLKNQSSFIVVVLRSLRHKACVRCGKKINSLDESFEHWEEALKLNVRAGK